MKDLYAMILRLRAITTGELILSLTMQPDYFVLVMGVYKDGVRNSCEQRISREDLVDDRFHLGYLESYLESILIKYERG